MNDINEEQILLEGTKHKILFDFDYINGGLYISIYNKEYKDIIVNQYKISNFKTIHRIKENIDLPIGSIIKKGNMKYIVRNHDKSMWNEKVGDYLETTEGDIFDDRTNIKELPIIPRLITNIKLAYIHI